MRHVVFSFPALERLIHDQPAATTLVGEVQRLGAKRVFLVVSGTMSRTTDEVRKLRAALGERYAGCYDQVAAFRGTSRAPRCTRPS